MIAQHKALNIDIQKYVESDYPLITAWWAAHEMLPPQEHTIPETSYMLYMNGQPSLSVSLYITNGSIGWIDNFVGNPELKGEDRKTASHILLQHLEDIAKQHGKNRVFCMSIHEKTTERYKELGFTQTGSNVATFIKEIK